MLASQVTDFIYVIFYITFKNKTAGKDKYHQLFETEEETQDIILFRIVLVKKQRTMNYYKQF